MTRILALLLLLGAAPAVAQDALSPQARFHEGAAAYRDGDYERAAQAWREVLAAGEVDGHVLYDLGNASWRLGELGDSILAWRQAQVLLPRDPDIRANLRHAREQARDALEPSSHVPTIFFWQHSLALSESATLGALLFGGALAALAGLRWRRRRGKQRELASLRPAVLVSAIVGLLLLLSTALTAQALVSSPAAVVLIPEIVGRSAVGADGVELFVLHEGAELRALELDADHVLLALPDGRKGWVPQAAVGLVRPGDGFVAAGL